MSIHPWLFETTTQLTQKDSAADFLTVLNFL